ncbi:MAG: tRNA guanosine(34) transglycosylase Tgt [Planctomycetota bacterium]|jgi:queuine tRNA-ribosyltransferase
MFSFQIEATDPGGDARLGRLMTPHGLVETPAFMPVGTAGAVKGITPGQLAETGARIVLANTYHLQLRPGADAVEALGGLHRFVGWEQPILTDSGGYQVFSLAELNDVSDDGVVFRSHVDGALVRLDPEITIDIQQKLGGDVIMALDQCPPIPCPRREVEAAVERTVLWARRCREFHNRPEQWLFGIVQGGLHHDLRRVCAERLIEIGFDGYAVGGLSVGESQEEMIEILSALAPRLPSDRPRYLMGVGMPQDIYRAVRTGIDLFDCVLPTRNGRNAYAFTAAGKVRLRNTCHRLSADPLEPGCGCYTCLNFSRGYLRHLFMSDEMLGPILTSIHNLFFYQRLMRRIRELIPTGKLETIRDQFPVVAAAEPN